MDLVKEFWTVQDCNCFNAYLESLQVEEKKEWTKRIVNTKNNVLAIPSPVLKKIALNIYKGNYLSFLDNMLNNFHENTIINGYLLNKIKDFSLLKKYLDIYSLSQDNWASCDILSFDVRGNENQFLDLINEYLRSEKVFVRRIAIKILFKFINIDLEVLFKTLDKLEDENEYYVNMITSWLLCDCFIKYPSLTYQYIETCNLNNFTINKFISKCLDSFRVSDYDKKQLLNYKR